MRPYRAHVERLLRRKPSLSNLSSFLSNNSTHEPCQIASLDFSGDSNEPKYSELDYDTLQHILQEDFCDRLADDNDSESGFGGEVPRGQNHIHGRILMIQDLDKDLIELLGYHIDIDPIFFAGHIHSPWKSIQAQVPEQCTLPSQIKRHNFINIHYHRTIIFSEGRPPAKKLLRRMNIERKVVVTPMSNGDYVGLVQHSLSVFFTRRKTKWLGLLLVDAPIDGKYLNSIEKGGPLIPITLRSQHYLGGYEDFLASPAIKNNESKEQRSLGRNGIWDDLLFYWSAEQPASFNGSNPDLHGLAYYPLRIVAAEWIKYIGIMYRALKQYEYSTSVSSPRDELEKLNTDMRALQSWRRRSMSSGYKVKAVIRGLKERAQTKEPSDNDLASLVEDFEYIAVTIEDFGRRLESMLPVVTSLVQIIDSRRSIDETANISRLTIMALIFVPLAYISSLFSMTDKLAPGGTLFWVYFVVAIPITIVICLVAKPPMNLFRKIYRPERRRNVKTEPKHETKKMRRWGKGEV